MAKTVSDCGGLKANIMTKSEFNKLAPKKNTKNTSPQNDKKKK